MEIFEAKRETARWQIYIYMLVACRPQRRALIIYLYIHIDTHDIDASQKCGMQQCAIEL
jgi:hypothetical protein